MSKTFLLEIGSEELPSKLIKRVAPQLKDDMVAAMDAARIAHGAARLYTTPRRLTVIVSEVAEKTPEINIEKRGPKVKAAFDADENPTPAALGFAKGAGVDVSDLVIKEDAGSSYVCATIHTPARDTKELLPHIIEETLASLKWPKSQRWGSTSVSYGRPVRWIVALFGTDLLGVSFGDVTASATSRGHRVLGADRIEIEHPEDYEEKMRENGVLSREERARLIKEQIKQIEEEHGVVARLPQQTFEEVVDLCEYPTALLGHFDEEFLSIPHEIICESMLSHQRYFPVYEVKSKDESSAQLTTGFIVVSNGDKAYAQEIIEGNERVVRARLDDAKFFFDTDVKIPLDERVGRLNEVVFQEKLGTLLDKTVRLEALVACMAEEAGAMQEEQRQAKRAAHVAKADLISQTVIEFTNQQGTMGGYFAAAQAEDAPVAEAIAQQYMPRFSGDTLPSTLVGKVLSLADKIDTLTGLFAIGEPPTGSSDPFALRRGAIGILRILEKIDKISLERLIDASLQTYKNQGLDFKKDEVAKQVKEFFATRLAGMAKERGYSADTIKAIENIGIVDPAPFFARAEALSVAKQKDPRTYEDLATAFSRAHNLLEKAQTQNSAQTKETSKAVQTAEASLDESLLGAPEKALFEACTTAKKKVRLALDAHDYEAALNTLAALRAPVDAFFENVMVMDEDPALRQNRLALLGLFLHLFDGVADISALAKTANS